MRYEILSIIFLTTSLALGCKKANNATTPSSPDQTVPQINSTYQGGKVFYILKQGDLGYDPNVRHGLIVAPKSTAQIQRYWGCYDVLIPNANATAIGMGKLNTINISNNCPLSAANYCQQLVLNGYDDWYLPSKGELDEFYKVKDILNQTTVNSPYISSSQIDSKWVYARIFTNTSTGGAYLKNEIGSVIPIRSF